MTAPLAKTSFQTSIDDTTAAVDVYTQTTAASPTDDSSSTGGGDPNDLTGFLGSNSDLSSLSSAVKDSTSLPLSPKDISQGVIAQNADLYSSFSTLDDGTKNALCAAAGISSTRLTDTLATAPTSTLSNAASTTNLVSLSGMLDVVGNKTKGALSVSNLTAQGQFLSNLVSVSAKLNIPNAYSRILAGNLSPAVVTQVTKAAVAATISTSNVNMLVDVANNAVSGAVKAAFPGFPAAFVANFKLGTGTNPLQHAQMGLDITSAFGKIDANWASTTKGSRTMINASLFANASPDFKTVMRASATFSRSPFASTTTITANVTASTLPNLATLPQSVQHTITPAGEHVFLTPDGTLTRYAPNTDGTFNQTLIAPATLGTSSGAANAVNTSALQGPLTTPYLFDQCLATGQADSAAVDPTLDASKSLQSNFPYLPFQQLPTFA